MAGHPAGPVTRLRLALLLLFLFACSRNDPQPAPDLLVGSWESEGDGALVHWSQRRSAPVRVWKTETRRIRDLTGAGNPARNLIAAGSEVWCVTPDRDRETVATFEGAVDAVRLLPEGDLLVLEHPGGDPEERPGPHRVHRLRPGGAPVAGEPREVHPLAYDLTLGGSIAVVTWLQGRDFEWSDLARRTPFERVSLLTGEPGETRNLRAVVRNAAFTPGGDSAWFVENAVLDGDQVDPEGIALWWYEFASRTCKRFALASRGYYQGGLVLLPSGQLLANGFDRLLLITLSDPIVERVISLSGHFPALAVDPGTGRVFMGGSDAPPPRPGVGRIISVALDPPRVLSEQAFPFPIGTLAILRE